MKPIEEMTGLELRDAVAVEVMGYGPPHPRFKGVYQRPNHPCECWDAVDSKFGVPAYESSIEAAFQVVGKMRENGFEDFELSTHGRDFGATFRGMVGKRWAKFYATGDTAPLAICRAALQAVRAE